MPQIKAYDVIQLNCSIDDVWNILTDIPQYNKWWLKVVNLKVLKWYPDIVGTEFQASPSGRKSFSCRVMSIVQNKGIKLNYFEGIYRGRGVWSIDKKENLISVSYKVDRVIVDKSIAVLFRIIPTIKLHSMTFKRILSRLDEQIKSK